MITPAWRKVTQTFDQAWPAGLAGTGVGVVVGCSGGADSVALTRLLAEHWRRSPVPPDRRGPLVIAHVNHGWRGDESDADEQFVRELAACFHLPMESMRVQEPVRDEASCRDIRRAFLVDVARRRGCRVVTLGHTADDQAETVLHQLCRGSGAAGLSGMSPWTSLGEGHSRRRSVDGDWVLRRPLLGVRRGAIREALRSLDQSWRDDASNADDNYTRNWFRGRIIPDLETRFPHVVDALTRAASIQSETMSMLDRLANKWLDRYSELDEPDQWRVRHPRNAAGADGTDDRVDAEDPWAIATDAVVIVRACQMAWDQLGWPRRDMTRVHWRRLADTITNGLTDSATDRAWPGGILASGGMLGDAGDRGNAAFIVFRRTSRP